jgi:acetoin utilization deacetylase AcuC-like enzyme
MGGGAHHGHYSFGHGFCIINDLVVAIRRLQSEEKIRSAWVIDIDAHKGDGTAALTAHDRSITTLSIHMATSWPLDLPRYDEYGREHPSYIASDIDIPISASENPEYLPRLRAGLKELSGRPKPDLVYVVGGVDPYEFDGLPSTQELQLSLDQLYERDVMVFDFLREMNVPQAWLMAGGYGERAWEPYVPYLEYALDRTMSAGAQSAG